ncbi:unnamed protein product [Periconia digitata]|uniref:Pre-mRNA-splicing factor CWC24 n=1 Tax=Periconia digitata TaxID=1303443 RepID=A0A9W4UEG1_9PLEO|nr:unnamed protein product [Periconia digitata]
MADTTTPVVKFKKRGAKAAPRKVAPPPTHSDSDNSASDSEADNDGRVVKRRKVAGNELKATTANDTRRSEFEGNTTKFEANRSAVMNDDELSTQNLLGNSRLATSAAEDVQKEVLGPKRPSNVRVITLIDYTPDTCKDYRLTGFCGFGDNCKFAHIREDAAAGWKLDKEWELSGNGKKASSGGTIVASANRDSNTGEKDEDGIDIAELEKIPFACTICEKPYKNPIMTKCGHYFCEACALKRYRKDPTCKNCGANTFGTFNAAKNVQKLLDRKKKWEDRKKAEAEAAEEGKK